MPNGVEASYTEKMRVPKSIISTELEGLYGATVLKEFSEIIKYYTVYEEGAKFDPPVIDGVTGASVRLKHSASLIDKEARFMFSVPVDITVNIDGDKEVVKAIQDKYQQLIDAITKSTRFDDKVLKAAKDCFIGKRVAYVVDFDAINGNVIISFIPSLGFVYSTDDSNTDILTKLIIFYATNDLERKEDQRIYKKKYELVDGKCVINEGIYNGLGEVVEEAEEIKTEFTYIPGGVILNGGLTGDMFGESDIAKIAEIEEYYNRLSASDIDAENKNMNPITFSIDADTESTAKLTRAPGAYWDIATDKNGEHQAQLGTIEPKMGYSEALTSTLARLKTASYEALEVPETSADALKGVVSSGKTLKAIYWGLMVRCDEKFIAWRAGIEHIVTTIIDGCRIYPECAKKYIDEAVPETTKYEIVVENNYPIQDDINEEKEMDLQEVHNKVRSKKSYMKKYMGLSDKEVEEELKQMALERQIEEGSYNFVPGANQQNTGTVVNNQQQETQQTPTFQDFLNGNQ